MNNEEFENKTRIILGNIAEITSQGAVFHYLDNQKSIQNSRVNAFCAFCLDQPSTASLCHYTACSAAMHSISFGEPCFQRCWAGLLCMTIALAPEKTCRGGLSLGGFYFEGESLDLKDTLKQRLSYMRKPLLNTLITRIPSLHETTPHALRGLGSFTLECTFSNGINSNSFFKRQNQKYIQQRRIAEAFADLRADTTKPLDITGDMYELASLLNRNDREATIQFISSYMAKILLVCNWNLVKLKAHLRVLLSVITSQEILKGADWTAEISRELRNVTKLEKAETTEDCCYEVAEIVMEYFSRGEKSDSTKGTIVDRTINWLQMHYHENTNLTVVSRGVGASISSIVHHLNRSLGKTYKEILGEIRSAEAKKLLATTSLGLAEVAMRCGFYDQSHFTKAFRRATNMTPGQFRHFLTLPKEEILK